MALFHAGEQIYSAIFQFAEELLYTCGSLPDGAFRRFSVGHFAVVVVVCRRAVAKHIFEAGAPAETAAAVKPLADISVVPDTGFFCDFAIVP